MTLNCSHDRQDILFLLILHWKLSPPPHSTSQFLFYFFLNNSEASNIENLSEIIKQGVLKSTNHWNDHSVMNANRCQIARFFSAYAFLLILYEIHITAGQGFVIIFACINFFRKGIAKFFFFLLHAPTILSHLDNVWF